MEKKCCKCNINKPISKYRKYTDKDNSYSATCKACLNEQDKQRKKDKRQHYLKTFKVQCEKCNESKSLENFSKLKKFYKKKFVFLVILNF